MVAEELYDHTDDEGIDFDHDQASEIFNVASVESHAAVKSQLLLVLRDHFSHHSAAL